MTQRSEPLKPCPFCGNQPNEVFGLIFTNCVEGCYLYRSVYGTSNAEQWNRRSGQPQPLSDGKKNCPCEWCQADRFLRKKPQPTARAIRECLADYRCQYTEDESGGGLPLADALSPGETIEEGQKELDILADDLSVLFAEALSTARTQERAKFEPLVEAATGLSHGVDWNNGTHAKLHGYRQKLLDALAALSGVNVSSDGGNNVGA